MTLSPYEYALVRDSLRAARAEMPPGDTRFYDRLFALRPDFREMFREDIAGQGMKFLTTLSIIVDALTSQDLVEQELDDLARNHAAMGVTPRHYAPMGDALIETFREVLGPAFTRETEAAWRAAYALIASRMMEAGQRH